MKNSYLTVTDMFCGAGGSSQGVRKVANRIGGIEVKLAMNHWKLAIETHNTNFPDTLHDCTDISACDPRRYPSTHIALMSPECTTHSPAGGNSHKALKKQMDMFNANIIDPATERSRATMWDVPRFAEYHKYEAIIVENVVEAKTRWVLFDSWLFAMQNLGYAHKCVYINSQHCHPTPQSRDRMYVVFWKKGNKAPNLDFMPLAYSPKIGKDVNAIQSWKNPLKKFGKYRSQYVYRCPVTGDIVEPYYHASFNVIDWSDLGTRIGDRKKELRPNTRARIEAGLDKYRDDPFTINDQHSTGLDFRVNSVRDKLPTIASSNNLKLVMQPFIIKGEHTMQEGYTRSVGETFQTQATRQTMGLVVPHIVELNSSGESKPSTEPFSTITAGMPNHGIMTSEAMRAFLTYYNSGTQTSRITEAVDVVPTHDRISLVTYQKPNIEDCNYRMIKPNEIKLAMAFERDYKVLGNAKDIVKQCGNAVTPPVMEWLVGQVVASLN